MLPSNHHRRITIDIIMTIFRMIRDTQRVKSRHRALAGFLFAAKLLFSYCLYDG